MALILAPTTEKISRTEIKQLQPSFKDLKKIGAISVLYPICCGIDVHKESIVACLFYQDQEGNKQEKVRTFSTFTDDIYRLKEWLLSMDCPLIAIESTGVYWRPVHNVLEDSIKVILVNARHFKNVPGRKTDVSDSRWLCTLLQYGLLRGSFIPEAQIRQWREINRLRRQISKSAGDYKRRVHKVFETANIKIDSVVSDLFGVTGRNLIDYLCQCEHPTLEGVTQCACGSLRDKVKELYRSIQGFFNEHHRLEIQSLMRIITLLEKEVQNHSSRLHSQIMEEHSELIQRLEEVPGISQVSLDAILAEIGFDLTAFKDANALCSWAGVCPGNNESAGKRYSGRSPVKKHPFREMLVEMAWAAIKKKNSFWKDKYYRLKARRGARRAIIAIARKLLTAIYYIIKDGKSYHELGEDYLTKNAPNAVSRLKSQARLLGFQLVPIAQ